MDGGDLHPAGKGGIERRKRLAALGSQLSGRDLDSLQNTVYEAIQDSSQLFRSVFHSAEYEGFEIVQFFCYEQLGFEFEQGTPSTTGTAQIPCRE
jgi:hypothetical protein